MKRILFPALCLLLTALVAFGAAAEPVLTNGTYTAYIGDSNYLYLEDETGAAKVMRAAISDLVSMNDTQLYCLTAEGKLYAVMLDGSSTSIVSASPTQADLDAVAAKARFTLQGNVLTVPDASGAPVTLSSAAVMAAANSTNVYYIESGAAGETSLYTVPLDPTAGLAAAKTLIGPGVASPISMTATDDALVIVAADHSLVMVNLAGNTITTFPATSQDTTLAICQGSKLIRYSLDDKNHYVTENVADSGLTVLGGASVLSAGVSAAGTTVSPSAAVTTAPAATPKPTQTTSAATATKKPTATATSASSDGSVRKGSSGSAVRKMQRRLSDLGYPVGTVDGSFGDNTLLAVNLFQDAIGYRERSYASASMLKKLYAKTAPVYDPYAPLKLDDSGTDVLIMQTALHDLGYDPGKLDGIFGKDTKTAVELFQFVAQLTVTGDADKDTLIKLYDLNAPRNPGNLPPVVVTNPPATKAPITPPPSPATGTNLNP